jgi:sporulation integral membrane protein YtvI
LGSWQSIQSTVTELLGRISAYLENNISLTATDAEEYTLSLVQDGLSWLTGKISSWAPNVVIGVSNLASGIASFLVSLLFFIVGAYFMTADYPHLRQRLANWVPDIIRPHIMQIKDAMGTAMFGYLKAQLILSGAVTLIIFLSLLILRQRYALLIALICGVIDLIPFFGSGAVLLPWAVVELFLGNFHKTIFLLVLCFALFLFRKLAEPKVVGNQTGLSPLLSLISIYVGMKLGGVVGMILAPILCMIFISLYSVGFFAPTITDFKMLGKRILAAASWSDTD